MLSCNSPVASLTASLIAKSSLAVLVAGSLFAPARTFAQGGPLYGKQMTAKELLDWTTAIDRPNRSR